jgi:cyanophycinase
MRLVPTSLALSLTSLLALAGCSPDENTRLSLPDDEDVTATSALSADASWQKFKAKRRSTRTITATIDRPTRIRLTWTDHNGFRAGVARPACALDVRVFDGNRPLTDTVYNSSQDANGTTPDPVEFDVTRANTKISIEVVEVDNYTDNFELKLEPLNGSPAPQSNTPPALSPPSGLKVYQVGATTNVSPPTRRAVLLAGGGTDNDAAMKALIEAGGRGDAVVLRMDDTGGAYSTYLLELGANSVRELAFDTIAGNDNVSSSDLSILRARADSPWVEQVLDQAEIVFFAGGNQTKYFDVFQGTALARAIDRLAGPRNGAIGGTSAGMHAMGRLLHTPRGAGNSITSDAALADPYIEEGELAGTASLSFSDKLFAIPGMENIVTDTHWSKRGRLGRSIVFLARVLQDNVRPLGELKLIASDEGTAVLIDANGLGRVYGPTTGTGSVFFFRPDRAPELCSNNKALEWSAGVPMVEVVGTPSGTNTFDVTQWTSSATAKRVQVTRGTVTVR